MAATDTPAQASLDLAAECRNVYLDEATQLCLTPPCWTYGRISTTNTLSNFRVINDITVGLASQCDRAVFVFGLHWVSDWCSLTSGALLHQLQFASRGRLANYISWIDPSEFESDAGTLISLLFLSPQSLQWSYQNFCWQPYCLKVADYSTVA